MIKTGTDTDQILNSGDHYEKREAISLCLAGLMAVSLAGCGGAGTTEKAAEASGTETGAAAETGNSEKKEELVFVNYRDIRDLNPHLYAGEMYAQEMLYETLVNITADGYEGCLAESWDISEDGKTYTFHIRDGVKFSDGEVCDANAIKANFVQIIENKDRPYMAGDDESSRRCFCTGVRHL